MSIFRSKLKSLVVVNIAVLTLVFSVFSLNAFESLNKKFQEGLYTANDASKEILIIGLDDNSIQPSPLGLGRFQDWTRDNYASLLESLKTENPSVISFDFTFKTATQKVNLSDFITVGVKALTASSNSKKLSIYEEFISQYQYGEHPSDIRFSNKLKEFNNIIIGVNADSSNNVIKPFHLFDLDNVTSASLQSDSDFTTMIPGFIDQDSDKSYDNLSLATVKKHLGKNDLNIPLNNASQMLINFFGPPKSYQHISFVDVVNGNFRPGTFTDKIVLVGPTSSSQFHDEYIVPTSDGALMSGVEIHANAIQTILDQKFLLPQSQTSQILTLLVITLLLTFLFAYTGILLSTIITIATLLLYLASAHIFFRQGVILNMVYPFIAIILTYFASISFKYFVSDKDKRQIKSAFGRYVNKQLVDQISENPEMVKLGGENREVTVFFSDIKDSTALSEKIAIEDWVKQINEYFTIMENVVMQAGGTIDKYEGDAIMGFWNAPVLQENHVTRAYVAALAMKEALATLNQKWQQEGRQTLEFRIGINTGQAIVGNFGSANRLDYTAMGDTVNTASRLESAANKTYGTTLCAAGADPKTLPSITLREIDTVLLPGKQEAVVIYEIFALTTKLTPEQKSLLQQYAQALAAYRQKNWPAAMQILQSLQSDPPSQVLLARCTALQSGQTPAGLEVESMHFRIAHK